MKKFIFTVNVIAIIALVPAVMIGYLHNDRKDNPDKTEVVKEVNNGRDDGGILHLIRTF